MVPPRRVRSAAASSSSCWSPGSGCERQRRSGRRARTPRPEQGASTSARSKPLSASSRTSVLTTRTLADPEPPDVLGQLAGAAEVELDGGHLAVQHRRLRARGRAGVEDPLAVARADRERGQLRAAALPDPTCVLHLEIGRARPGRRPGRRSASPSGTAERTTSSAGSFWARISASASSAPQSRTQVCVDPVRVGLLERAVAAARRRGRGSPRRAAGATAFVKPVACGTPAARTSSTASLTTACGGASLQPSSYAAIRRAARTGGSSSLDGRLPRASMPWSIVRMRCTVP